MSAPPIALSQFLYSDLNATTAYLTPFVYDSQSIKQALDNLLNTRKGQRIFNIDYGTNLESLLLRLFGDDTALLIRKDVYDAVTQFERRVSVSIGKTIVTPDFTTGTYNLNMPGTIAGLSPNKFVYSAQLIPPSKLAA